MILSFIVPIYNVGSLLNSCLESIYNIRLNEQEFEVLLVDDCSPMRLEENRIFEKYKDKYHNITILRHEQNGGLSAARNTGLNNARGKYVWFVDSDDSINAEYIPMMLDKAEENSLDVACFGFSMIYEENGTVSNEILTGIDYNKVYCGSDFLMNVPIHIMAWSAIYRRDFLIENALFFCEGILHEDQDFTPRAYFLAKRISYFCVTAYNYLQRNGSIMKSVNPKKIKDLVTICNNLLDFANAHTEAHTKEYYFFINRISFLYAQSLRNQAICGYEDMRQLAFYPLSINKYLSNREKLQYRLINLSTRLYVLIKRLMLKVER